VEGYVIGVDMTAEMLHQAREKLAKTQLKNLEFMEADFSISSTSSVKGLDTSTIKTVTS
jgi:tRNA G46 methylase TrmB